MATRIGINGFGRMGRLALRAGWGRPDLEFVHINEVAADPRRRRISYDSLQNRASDVRGHGGAWLKTPDPALGRT